MSKWAAEIRSGTGGPQAPAGTHPAVMVGLIDLGTIPRKYEGLERWERSIMFVWELVEETPIGTPPMPVLATRVMKHSMHDKAAMRVLIESRLGKHLPTGDTYDLMNELGQPCLLGIVQNKDFTTVATMTAVPKGFKVKTPTTQLFTWHSSELEPNKKPDLPKWVPTFMGKQAVEWMAMSQEARRPESKISF